MVYDYLLLLKPYIIYLYILGFARENRKMMYDDFSCFFIKNEQFQQTD